MKISKSNVALAAKIKSSGFEWPQFGKWATQDRGGEIFISGGDFTPVRMSGEVNWEFDAPYKSVGKVEVGLNWFQCILSREEYFHLYPAPDADGWIEHDGKHEPEISTSGLTIWCKWSDGLEQSHEANMVDWIDDSDVRVVAYRLHKQEQAKPQFCESVMRSIPEPDEQVWTNPPTIEQLAADYRNAKDYADRKQDEADKASMESDAALSQLEDAIAAIGFVITPLAATEKEPELVAAVKVGDQVECVESNIKRDKYNGMVGRLHFIDESDTSTPYLVDFGVAEKIWCHEVKFIRRP